MRREKGFTLIEIMVTVGIIAILAAIALPAYRDYVLRGQLANASSGLATMRAQMEQFYQDNRTYVSTASATSPCPTTAPTKPNFGLFNVYCPTAPTASTYVISAIGTGSVAAFTYTVDQNNNQTTVSLQKGWTPSGTTLPASCWILKRGASC